MVRLRNVTMARIHFLNTDAGHVHTTAEWRNGSDNLLALGIIAEWRLHRRKYVFLERVNAKLDLRTANDEASWPKRMARWAAVCAPCSYRARSYIRASSWLDRGHADCFGLSAPRFGLALFIFSITFRRLHVLGCILPGCWYTLPQHPLFGPRC